MGSDPIQPAVGVSFVRVATGPPWAPVRATRRYFEASRPPASAKSGRPPPPPPTIGASSLTRRPAWMRSVRSLETDTTSVTLPSSSEASTTTPLPRRSRRESRYAAQARSSRAPRRDVVISFTPRDASLRLLALADAHPPSPGSGDKPPSASFIFSCSTSRPSRFVSACSRWTCSTACARRRVQRSERSPAARRAVPASR